MERALSSQAFEPVKLDRSTIVRAGAGAGKTTALTEHVLDVAREFHKLHERYPRIVVTTFTKKATQELKERLVLLALQKDNELLEFVNSSSILKISTIHGILDQYLRQYGSFLNLDPSFTVINSSMASQLARQVIRRILLNHPQKEILQSLIDDFTFKRLEKLCREYYRIKMQYPEMNPHNESSLEKITQDHVYYLASKIDEMLTAVESEEPNPKWQDYANHMKGLSLEIKREGFSQSFDFLKNLFESAPTATKNKNVTEETNEFKKDLSARLRDLFDDECYHPGSFRQFAEKFELCRSLFDSFADEFLQLKIQMAAVEINDLELFSLKLSRDFGETAKAFSDEWDYWLIDEYQDTSPVQVELIEKLSQTKPQYVVGDPQQSIYLFRGARSEVFQSRESEILSNQGVKLEKIRNYRSKPELLEFFNDFFDKFQIPFSPMIANWPSDQKLSAAPLVAKIYLAEKLEKGAENSELLAITEHIGGLVRDNVRLEDICILARTNKNLVEISKVLTQFGLINHVHVSSGFYGRREIQDALALYKFLIHPHNNLNLLVLLRSPWFLVDDQFLVDQLVNARESYWIFLSQFKPKLPSLHRLAKCLERSQEIGIGHCFLECLIDSGMFDLSKQNDHSGRAESNLWKLVSLLREEEQKPGFNPLDLIAQIESDARADQDSEGDAITAVEPERINLMTIHASKGLQFRHVVVARMNKRPKSPHEPDFLFDEESLKWSIKIPLGPEEKFTGSVAEKNHVEKMKRSEINEHARVLYVAMTRAIESVFLSWTNPPESNSWAQMIHFDLDPGLHKLKHYSYEVLTAKPSPQVWESKKALELPVRSQFVDLKARAETQNFSVTEILEKNSSVKQKSVKEPTKWLDQFKSVSHGSITHKLMQAMKYSRDLDTLIDRWFQSEREEVHRALDFMKGLKEPPLMNLIENGHVEMGFSYREGERIIDGQIDLWGIADGKVWIVDYKTGSVRYREKAFLQLEYYAKALLKSGRIDSNQKIQLSVIYPFSANVFNKTF